MVGCVAQLAERRSLAGELTLSCLSVCVSVHLQALSRSHFLIDFHQNWHRRKNPKRKNQFVGGQYQTTPSPILHHKTPILCQKVLKPMQILSNSIYALNVCESPIFSSLIGNWGWGTRWWRQILDQKWKYGRFTHAQWKICNITVIYGQIAKILAYFRKSGSRNAMVASDFRPEMEIWLFRACAMKNTQYNPYLWPNRWNFRVFQEIGVEKHDNTMVTSDFRPEVEIRPVRACAMHLAIIIRTVRSLWTWLWGRYHVPQNAFLVFIKISIYMPN